MRDSPLVTIVTPSYNQADFLERTILSVLNQDYPHIEYIVIDGGSTDGSIDIIKKYEKNIAHWISEPDNGQSSAINKGFKNAKGEILNWLNSDDILMPSATTIAVDYLCKNPEYGMVYGDRLVVDEHDQVLACVELSSFSRFLYRFGGFLPQETSFFRRDLWRQANGLDESLHISMDSHRPELHDHLRNQPGLFRSVERSIRSLLESRQRAGRSTPRIIVRCTVSRANFREMEAFASYWSERVDGILFQAVQHNALHSVRDRDLLFGPQDEPAFRRAVVALQRAHPFCRNRYHDLMPDYLFRPEALSRRLGLRCLLMSSVALTVLPDGRVVICYGSEDSVVGRLPDRSVHSIWTDPRTKAAQAALRQPHCGDYCWETHTPFNLFLVGLDRIWPF